ncbi:putative repeat protein (TIGR01451 family)/gliding motility-associated-like protein [Pontibacter ummariensis]|uniref:Conserved repeat domain-containing protein/gliding motility-associated C-terminal domain-containing protein n=1 Tax=Pontibacter ummariensis TaxID=1610492 RepID=A0A239CX09_9BACT|nr:ice-binding family protein [Pontibacter ummariensis]PRY14771.1 putative repeat protein (TIGR01451 family)/gliding motility-associated-like protein [Pontibacter ummariensis]SNS24786.1 conserved repeat domain-containing protein/gliding motility-associated C-terminal domain-containing protein [Pontibacter ummariensis]
MIRSLLLVYVFLAVGITLGFAQTGTNLNRARGFAVLAQTKVTNTGNSTVRGDLGVSPNDVIEDAGKLTVLGGTELANTAAANALTDAGALYDALKGRPATVLASSSLGGASAVAPGVYKVNGNADLSRSLFLDGKGDVNATYVFIIDGDFAVNPNAGVIAYNGTQSKNIFWVVQNSTTLTTNIFLGNILAKGDITLNDGTGLTGRAISLEGAVHFRSSTVLLPDLIETDLVVEKKVEGDRFIVGEEVTFVITAYNAGPNSTTNVIVEEFIPEGLEFVRAEPSKGNYNETTNNWEIAELRISERATLRLVFKITKAGEITNRVSIDGYNSETNPADNEDEETITTIPPLANVGVTKRANESRVALGDNVSYIITVSNAGPGVATDVEVTEQIPQGLTFVSADPAKGTYDETTNKWLVGELANGESTTMTIVFKTTVEGAIENSVTVVSDNTETEPGDNNDKEPIEVTPPRASVSVSKQANENRVALGDNVSYTITVSNAGPGDARNVVVQENVPQGLTFVSASTEKGTYDATTNQWLVGGLANGESATLTLVFKTTAEGPLVNSVTVVSDNPDPDPADNEDQDPIDVTPPKADVSVTKRANESQVALGANVSYTITVSNAGPGVATDVEVTEQIPQGLTFVSADPAKGTYDETTNKWLVGELANGESTTMTIVFKTTATGSLVNSVKVVSDNTETEPGDNEDQDPVDVICPELNLSLTGQASLCPGTQNLTYTVTQVAGATYSYTLPEGWELVSQNGNTVVVNAGADAVSGSIKATVTDACGKTADATLNVQVVTPPTLPVITGASEVCVNSTGNVYSVSGFGPGVTYAWTASGDLEITSATNSATVEVSAGTQGGTLTLVVSNSCFSSEAATKVITTLTAPEAPAAVNGSTTVCAGTTVEYSVEPVDGADSYTWTLPAGWVITAGEGTATVSVTAGSTAGNISVTANNSCGSSSPATLAVQINDKLAAPAISGETGDCVGSALTYTIDEVAGATGYDWSVPATWTIVSGQNTTSITVEVGAEGGNISVAVVNECGTGTASTLAVAPRLAPVAPSVTGNTEVCQDSQNLTYTISNPAENVTYAWTVPAGWEIISGQGTTSITVNAGNTGGAISVAATNNCGTTEGTPLAVNVAAPLVAPGPISDNSDVCEGLTYSIAAVPGATEYTWTVPAGFTITSGQGTTTIKVKASNPASTGTVSVMASNATCSSPVTSATMDASLADGQLVFPKAFSPNGDGRNDTWEIKNLEKFTNNEVTIFNRWGSELYKMKNYQNDWNGKRLEQGTYFYKVRVTVCDGVVKEYTGYTTIFR